MKKLALIGFLLVLNGCATPNTQYVWRHLTVPIDKAQQRFFVDQSVCADQAQQAVPIPITPSTAGSTPRTISLDGMNPLFAYEPMDTEQYTRQQVRMAQQTQTQVFMACMALRGWIRSTLCPNPRTARFMNCLAENNRFVSDNARWY